MSLKEKNPRVVGMIRSLEGRIARSTGRRFDIDWSKFDERELLEVMRLIDCVAAEGSRQGERNARRMFGF